jgi:flagellar hook-associated protein 2
MSSSSTTSSSFAPLQFTGISQYSSDFQQILSRAVSIAQIPVMQMTNEQTQILTQETTLGNLSSSVSNLSSALQAIGKLGSGQALAASSTDAEVVTATATGASSAASYSVTNVTSLAAAASERSQDPPYADGTTAVSTTGKMKLVYGGKSYNIDLTGAGQNNVIGLTKAINDLNVGVTASVLTPGTGAYLAVSADSPGATTLQLMDDPTGANNNILTNTNQGTNTEFDLNGIHVSSPGTTVNSLIPGVTLNFKGTTANSETVTVGLATDRSQMSSALQTLASAYNSLQTQVAGQFTASGGALSGNNILYQIRQAMSNIVQYQGGGSMGNLANLGIEMQIGGQMTFNQTTFNALSDSQISSALSLFGTSTTGIGGLQKTFNSISDPVTGSIALQTADWSARSRTLTDQINAKNQSIMALQLSVNQRLQAADAAIANLATQQSTLTASITSLSYVSYGYNTNSQTSNSI